MEPPSNFTKRNSASKKSTPTNRGSNLNRTLLSKTSTSTSRGSKLNETLCGFKASTPTSRGLNLNETVCASSSEISAQILEMECDLAYNDYLQALMKQEIVASEIKRQKQVLEGQILLQNENIQRRKENYDEIMKEIDLLEKRNDLVQLINSLEANIKRVNTVYSTFKTETSIEKLVLLLQSESDEVIVRNVKPIRTQDEYDKLINVLGRLNATMERILKSGRNFAGINDLARQINTYVELSAKVRDLQTVTFNLEQDAVSSIMQSLSDSFAKQYVDSD